MPVSTKPKTQLDAYRFAGVRPKARLRGVFGDSKARIITLTRRSKKLFAVVVAEPIVAFTIVPRGRYGISPLATCASTWGSRCAGWSVEVVAK
jgi:hypothetical protein